MPSIVRRSCLYTSGLPVQGQGPEDSLAAFNCVPAFWGTGKLTLGGACSAVKIRTAIMTGDIKRQMPPFQQSFLNSFPVSASQVTRDLWHVPPCQALQLYI